MTTKRSRGEHLSSYFPGFGDAASGEKVYVSDLKEERLSGTATCAGVVYSVTHHLGVAPKVVIVQPILTLAQAASAHALVANQVSEAVCASTSTVIYVATNLKGLKYKAYLLA